DVYHGKLEGRSVCIKVPRLWFKEGDPAQEGVLRAFMREATLWRQLNHPNVLPLLGVDRALFAGRLCFVSSLMANGNAMDFIKNFEVSQISRLRLLHKVAKGLSYIHSRRICHGDIKGANILVDENFEPRIADLGIASVLSSQSESIDFAITDTTASKGSLRWCPPEVIHPDHFVKPKNSGLRDVYSFGRTVLEVLTGSPPFGTAPDTLVIVKLFTREGPPRPDGFRSDVWKLIEQCCEWQSNWRPSSDEVVVRISNILDL
ncbi:kinase-like domain-containing protein, partial [Flagelloscypha sp. PMI_526]